MSRLDNQTQVDDTNSVEFKSINNYKKNVNVLNKLSYIDNQNYTDLTDYLKDFALSRDSEVKSNITAPIGRFFIDDENMARVFELLEKCYRSNIVLHFRELQLTDLEKKIGSGIMFDFDLLQESDKNEIHLKDFSGFVRRTLTILNNVVKIDDLSANYVGIIVKQKLVYKEDKKIYKNGFHMLIPSAKITRQAKKILLQEMLADEMLNEIFIKQFENKLSDAFDIGSVSVPVYYLHNCKEESNEPYKLIHIYKGEHLYDGLQVTPLDVPQFMSKYNSVKEFSLNISGALIKKKFCELREPFHSRMMARYATQNKKEEEREEAISAFDKYNSYVDDNLVYYKKIVLDILHIKRAEDRNLWRNVLFALANISPNLRPAFKVIAKLFSMRCEGKYDSIEFEKMWETATNSNSDSKITINSLIFWAKEDNAAAYKKLLHKDIRTTIELDVFSRENKVLTGSLYQYHFAYYIFHLFKQKFVFDVDNTGKNGMWYEFVLDSDVYKDGEIYKWRTECRPDNLILFMSNRLPDIISEVLEKAENRLKTVEDENIAKYISERMNKLRVSAQGLYKTEFKNGVIKEAETFFRKRGFSEKLDNSDNTMGVSNGVLELSKNPRLLTGYHNYPVSLFSDVRYIPYDKHNPHVKKLLSVLLSLVPEDEIDVFHYLMYYLSTSLDAKAKNSEIFILTGSGSNGKSTLAELIKAVLGKYAAKVNMSILTEQRNTSSSANEQMMVYKKARLAFYSETNKAEKLNCAMAKELTSQESITGRGIFEKQTTFRPMCNHLITTNYPFTVNTTDHGIWRRLRTYEFKIKFTNDPDPSNKFEKKADMTIAKEFAFNQDIKEAFLTLLVEYYRDLQTNHNGELTNIDCPTIVRESALYRNQQDTLNRFICDNVIYSPTSEVCSSELADKYETWLIKNIGKNSVPERVDINSQIMNSIIVKYVKRTNTKIIFKGVRLLDDMLQQDILADDELFLKEKLGLGNVEDMRKNYDLSKFNPLNL